MTVLILFQELFRPLVFVCVGRSVSGQRLKGECVVARAEEAAAQAAGALQGAVGTTATE